MGSGASVWANSNLTYIEIAQHVIIKLFGWSFRTLISDRDFSRVSRLANTVCMTMDVCFLAWCG